MSCICQMGQIVKKYPVLFGLVLLYYILKEGPVGQMIVSHTPTLPSDHANTIFGK